MIRDTHSLSHDLSMPENLGSISVFGKVLSLYYYIWLCQHEKSASLLIPDIALNDTMLSYHAPDNSRIMDKSKDFRRITYPINKLYNTWETTLY